MAWTYSQKTGALTDPSGKVIAHGYSGNGAGLNDPTMEHAQGVGPIPRGGWSITALRLDTETHGPFVLVLQPRFKCKRSGFLIHGDNSKGDKSASRGCIIVGRDVRQAVWNSSDRSLEVVE